jgi:hypothetical protein
MFVFEAHSYAVLTIDVTMKPNHNPGTKLTKYQRRVLVGVELAIRYHDRDVVTVREVAECAGYKGPSGVYLHLMRLATKGYVEVATKRGVPGVRLLKRAPKERN